MAASYMAVTWRLQDGHMVMAHLRRAGRAGPTLHPVTERYLAITERTLHPARPRDPRATCTTRPDATYGDLRPP